MTYEEAVGYLISLERLGIKFGLENIGTLAGALEHPEHAYRSVLIAGTNGKGSTTAIIESVFRSAGYRTGRYTSPHLVRLEERMTAAGKLIAPEELASVVERVRNCVECLRNEGRLLLEPTFFELTTACALEFFRRKSVDVAVLEVGMGGRWDATNIAPASLTVITKIGFDHERFLGSTLTEIAAEKAAIIKPGRPAVVGFIEPEPLDVIRAEAERLGSPLIQVEREVKWRARETEAGHIVRMETPEAVYAEMSLPLRGVHQLENLAVAVRAVEVARRVGLPVDAEAMAAGVAATLWEGRLERIHGRPEILIDSAHNAQGAQSLACYLEAHPRDGRVLLFGVMKDKNAAGILEPLRQIFAGVVVTRPPNRRAKDPEWIVSLAREQGFRAEAVEVPKQALARARRLAGETGEVVVAGSTFLAGEVKRILEHEEEPGTRITP